MNKNVKSLCFLLFATLLLYLSFANITAIEEPSGKDDDVILSKLLAVKYKM